MQHLPVFFTVFLPPLMMGTYALITEIKYRRTSEAEFGTLTAGVALGSLMLSWVGAVISYFFIRTSVACEKERLKELAMATYDSTDEYREIVTLRLQELVDILSDLQQDHRLSKATCSIIEKKILNIRNFTTGMHLPLSDNLQPIFTELNKAAYQNDWSREVFSRKVFPLIDLIKIQLKDQS